MHHVRFRDPAGDVRWGRWPPGEGTVVAAPSGADVPAFLGGEAGIDAPVASGESFAAGEVTVLQPCDPTKVVCVGLNYADHAAEQGKEIPDRPLLFLKPPSALAAHGETLSLLPDKQRIDHEAELGVVIGERCRNVPVAEATGPVAGFTCVNDVSNRDDQAVEQNWVRGKAFDDSCPVGPVVATPGEVPADAAVRARLNGEVVQDSSRDAFIFSVAELIAEITSYMTLEPGDVVSTGTPAGVGPLTDGDTVAVEVEGVGTLRNDVSIP